MTLVESALRYTASGMAVIPVDHRDKRPIFSWKEFQSRKPTEQEVRTWFTPSVRAMACITGSISGGLCVFDFDVPGYYEKWCEIIGDIAKTFPTQRTGGGGYQVFFRCDDPGHNAKLAFDVDSEGKKIAIETRASGGYVLIPPSIHPSGREYTWLPDSPRIIPKIDTETTKTLFNAAKSLDMCEEVSEAEIAHQWSVADGRGPSRRNTGDGGALSVIEAYNRTHDVEDLLLANGYTRKGRMLCRPGAEGRHSVWIKDGKSYHHSTNDELNNGHLRDAFDVFTHFEHGGNVRSAVKTAAEMMGLTYAAPAKGAGKMLGQEDGDGNNSSLSSESKESEDLTDIGHAQRLVRICGNEIMYNAKPFGSWYIWTGKYWKADTSNWIFSKLHLVYRDIVQEARDSGPGEYRKELLKAALKLQSASTMRNVVFAATTDQEVSFAVDDLDASPWLFNCASCTIDLESGEAVARPHDPRDRITKISPVEYDPDAVCPQWKQFLTEIFAGDEELITYIKRVIGYCLTGNTDLQSVFFAYGLGANGKSIFFHVIESLLGDYAGRVLAETLMMSRHEGIPSDIAMMHGKRFVVASELSSGKRLNEAKIKDLTGSDKVRARKMYEDYFEFSPTHTLFMYGNHKPDIPNNDNGIWRRMKLIPFTVTIPKEKQVEAHILHARFAAEASGILNWALQGYAEYRERGLCEPKCVTEAVKEYKSENDIIGDFIAEKCMVLSYERTSLKSIAEAFRTWAADNGEREVSSRALAKKIRENGFTIVRSDKNKQYVEGITLI